MSWSGGTYTRSNGTYTGASVWQTDQINAFNIESSRHDTHDQDLATGINTCLTKDGQNTPTANLPMGGFLHTNVGTATARTNYPSAAQCQDNSMSWAGTSGGAGGAYTASLTPAPASLTTGLTIRFAPNHVNGSGSVTLNLNGLGVKDVLLDDGSAYVPGGFFRTAALYTLVYSGVVWYVVGQAPRRAQAWSSTYGSQAGSWPGAATYSRWCNLGGSTYAIEISASGTLSTASSNYLTFDLPYASENLGGPQYAAAYTFNGSTEPMGFFEIVNNSQQVRVYRSASAQWTVGASRAFHGNFVVELQ
jgi:hypothetical protein